MQMAFNQQNERRDSQGEESPGPEFVLRKSKLTGHENEYYWGLREGGEIELVYGENADMSVKAPVNCTAYVVSCVAVVLATGADTELTTLNLTEKVSKAELAALGLKASDMKNGKQISKKILDEIEMVSPLLKRLDSLINIQNAVTVCKVEAHYKSATYGGGGCY